MKNPLTAGIEPATFPFVAQRFKICKYTFLSAIKKAPVPMNYTREN